MSGERSEQRDPKVPEGGREDLGAEYVHRGGYVYRSDGHTIADVRYKFSIGERIAASLNACKGMPTDLLERYPHIPCNDIMKLEAEVKDLREAVKKALLKLDALNTAAEMFCYRAPEEGVHPVLVSFAAYVHQTIGNVYGDLDPAPKTLSGSGESKTEERSDREGI